MKNKIKRYFVVALVISGLLLPQIGNACMDWDDADSWSIDDWDEFVSSGDAFDYYGIDGHVIENDNTTTTEDDLTYALEQLFDIYGEEGTAMLLNANIELYQLGEYFREENTQGYQTDVFHAGYWTDALNTQTNEVERIFIEDNTWHANITFNDKDGDGILDNVDVNGFTDTDSDRDGDGVADYVDDNPDQPWWGTYGTLDEYIGAMQTEGRFDDEFIVDLDDDPTTPGDTYYAPNLDNNNPDNGIYSEPVQDLNCSEQSVSNSNNISDLYNKPLFKDNFNSLKTATSTNTEKIFPIGRDLVGNYSTDTGTDIGDEFSVASPEFPYMIATAHNHTKGSKSCFSIGDLYVLASSNKTLSDFTVIYVVGEKETFAFEITDKSKFDTFITNHPKDVFLDLETNMFKKDVIDSNGGFVGSDFNQYYYALKETAKLSPEDAFAHALAYLLFTYDMGVSLMKAEFDANGAASFKEIKTEAVLNSATGIINYTAKECK